MEKNANIRDYYYFYKTAKKERHTYNETYTSLVIVTRTISPSVTSMVGPGYCPFAAYNHLRAEKMLLQSGEADDKGDVSSPPRNCSNVKSYSTRSAFTNISKDDDDNNDPPFVVNNSSAATKVAEILLKRDEGEFIVVVSNLYLFVCRSSLDCKSSIYSRVIYTLLLYNMRTQKS